MLRQQRLITLADNQALLTVGQSCSEAFFVASGRIRIETPVGPAAFALTGALRPLEIYIEQLGQAQYAASNTLRAMMASTVNVIPLSVLQSLVLKYPDVGFELLQHGFGGVKRLRQGLRRVKSEPARTQVARTLYDVAVPTSDGGRVLERGITQSDLADFTGLSREAVNKELRLLSEASLVRKSSRGMEIDPLLASTDFLPWND